jgi:hypothetical protein
VNLKVGSDIRVYTVDIEIIRMDYTSLVRPEPLIRHLFSEQ